MACCPYNQLGRVCTCFHGLSRARIKIRFDNLLAPQIRTSVAKAISEQFEATDRVVGLESLIERNVEHLWKGRHAEDG